MSSPTACAHCGAHTSEARPWLTRIHRAVNDSKPSVTIDLRKLATDVEEMAARLKGLEK
jgi:hypothetical protein